VLCYRAQAELEESLIDEELQRLLGEYVESRVREALASEHVQASLAERLKVGIVSLLRPRAWLVCAPLSTNEYYKHILYEGRPSCDGGGGRSVVGCKRTT
jgi:hypothetical protein